MLASGRQPLDPGPRPPFTLPPIPPASGGRTNVRSPQAIAAPTHAGYPNNVECPLPRPLKDCLRGSGRVTR